MGKRTTVIAATVAAVVGLGVGAVGMSIADDSKTLPACDTVSLDVQPTTTPCVVDKGAKGNEYGLSYMTDSNGSRWFLEDSTLDTLLGW